MSGLVYLATPYKHPDPAVRQARYEAVNHVAVDMMNRGVHVYSPITHNHPLAKLGSLPITWEYWEKYDRLMLSFCCEMVVLRQDGWKESVGVSAEIEIAKEFGIPISYIDPKK